MGTKPLELRQEAANLPDRRKSPFTSFLRPGGFTITMSNLAIHLGLLGLKRAASVWWWDRRLYRCLNCGRVLRRAGTQLACRRCRTQFPIVNGVPILLRAFRMLETPEPPSETSLRGVCEAYGISVDGVALEYLASVLSKSYQFDESFLESENNCLLRRLAIGANAPPAIVGPGRGPSQFKVIRHYIPPELQCATKSSHNIRIRNTGEEPLTRYSLDGWQLCGRWIDTCKNDLGEAGKPSPLPISVLPGRELTIPFWLESPSEPGEYTLAFSLIAGDRLLHNSGEPIHLRASQRLPHDYAALEPVVGPLQPGYDDDHRVAIRIMERMVHLTGARRGLEIGGSSSPMTTNLPAQIVNTDVDAQTLQVGSFVLHRRGHRNVTFACCDALHLPFAKGAFDFAAMFSTLHHFADPAEALRSVANAVKPDGFVAVMCEPVGHYYDRPDGEMQQVLEHGINEQRFTLDEYARLFHCAGLRPLSSQLDFDSLKVILTRIV
jgi:SAM-dependent methyltransferase/uncharacterized protein YbaR (Trm112 family)